MATHHASPFTFSSESRRHLLKTIELLKPRIEDPEIATLDTTVAVVITLAMIADAVGDEDACKAHTEGLRRIVKMRGGMLSFAQNRQLQIKILR